jgi:hypothetical protein
MGDRTRIEYGVEWNSVAAVPGTVCGFDAIPTMKVYAQSFRDTMSRLGHKEIFAWGNADAWASDFEHPEINTSIPGDKSPKSGNSLNWVDNVHMVYVDAHGAKETSVSLASTHFSCRAYYKRMRLGVKKLRWLILNICDAVIDPGDSVMRVWSEPSDGDSSNFRRSLHMVCAYIGEPSAGADFGRPSEFATNVSLGMPVGNAWLDAAFSRSGDKVNAPIAIAFGRDEADATARREQSRLSDRDLGSVEANYLSWKWRA